MEVQREARFNGAWFVGFHSEGQETPPAADASAVVKNAFRLQSDKAYSLIALNVEKDLQVHISSVTDPLAAWKILQERFEFVSVTQIVRLNRKFYAASMKEGSDLMQHLTHMTSLAEQLREMNDEISLKKFATVVLGSLPHSHDNFLTTLNARSADDLDWENVKGLLIEEYMKRTDKNEKQESDNVKLVAVAVAVAVADFRILTSMLSPAVMIVINTEVLSASSATRMDIS